MPIEIRRRPGAHAFAPSRVGCIAMVWSLMDDEVELACPILVDGAGLAVPGLVADRRCAELLDGGAGGPGMGAGIAQLFLGAVLRHDRRSEEHTSELQ